LASGVDHAEDRDARQTNLAIIIRRVAAGIVRSDDLAREIPYYKPRIQHTKDCEN
jgi:hypothetical protein